MYSYLHMINLNKFLEISCSIFLKSCFDLNKAYVSTAMSNFFYDPSAKVVHCERFLEHPQLELLLSSIISVYQKKKEHCRKVSKVISKLLRTRVGINPFF